MAVIQAEPGQQQLKPSPEGTDITFEEKSFEIGSLMHTRRLYKKKIPTIVCIKNDEPPTIKETKALIIKMISFEALNRPSAKCISDELLNITQLTVSEHIRQLHPGQKGEGVHCHSLSKYM